MTGKPNPSKYVRVRRGVEKIISAGPVEVAIDRVTHRKALVIKLPGIEQKMPIPIDDEDLRHLGIEILRSLGTTYDYGEPIPESVPPREPPRDDVPDDGRPPEGD